jgi:hypothetical protein
VCQASNKRFQWLFILVAKASWSADAAASRAQLVALENQQKNLSQSLETLFSAN